jgi:predicted acylesterase/phospholipase RssA
MAETKGEGKLPLAGQVIYFLVLSGGAFRGAVQYWVIAHLLKLFRYKAIYGVSVGSINGAMAAMDKMTLLLDFWNSIDGKSGYLAFRWLYWLGKPTGMVWLLKKLGVRVVAGIYSMAPLKKKLEQYVVIDEFETPFVAGVVDGNTGIYYNMDTRNLRLNRNIVSSILASACMVPYMEPPLLDIEGHKGLEVGFDGGFRNIFPIPIDEVLWLRKQGARVILHAIGCTPLKRLDRIPTGEVISNEIKMGLRGIEIMEAEIYDTDILKMRELVGPEGEVHLWLPSYNTGESFDASKETIQKRLAEGQAMVKAGPVILKGL